MVPHEKFHINRLFKFDGTSWRRSWSTKLQIMILCKPSLYTLHCFGTCSTWWKRTIFILPPRKSRWIILVIFLFLYLFTFEKNFALKYTLFYETKIIFTSSNLQLRISRKAKMFFFSCNKYCSKMLYRWIQLKLIQGWHCWLTWKSYVSP